MKRPYSAWKEGAPYYVPQFVIGAVLLAALWSNGFAAFSALFFITGLYTLSFFRDPARAITTNPKEVVCPADGTIVGIEELSTSPHYEGPCKRISIFLSVFNVHVNRTPFDGVVRDIRYKKGLFKDARKTETSECNESNAMWLDTSRYHRRWRYVSR
ncbi:MAG: phosphatidylserine decarboxylase [Candidatus Hydrogenedentes bacterium]|nr:phosphatidylserine decarboxylase [Candidatus Hydrogenedentota bacterium]